jgi:hypothetical protein
MFVAVSHKYKSPPKKHVYFTGMNPLHEAILLNNAGVRLLDCGNVEHALHSFQCAVSSVKMATTTAASFEKPLFRADATLNDSSRCKSLPESAPQDMVLSSSSNCMVGEPKLRLDGLKNGVSYIFNRPLVFPANLSIQSSEQLNSAILSASTFIVFNFALACHFFGKTCGKEDYLTRAARLYELTLKVLGSASASCATHNDRSMYSILECLTLNNLAQLYYEQCDYATCQMYMDAMYDLFMSAERMDGFLDAQEMEEIMLNFVYLQSPPVAKAA